MIIETKVYTVANVRAKISLKIAQMRTEEKKELIIKILSRKIQYARD